MIPEKIKTIGSVKDRQLQDILASHARTINALIWSIEWHYVGADGEPDFENDWINSPGAFQACRFSKTPEGKLIIEGRIEGGLLDTVVFTLPEGYRPPKNLLFKVPMASAGYVKVVSTGEVSVVTA